MLKPCLLFPVVALGGILSGCSLAPDLHKPHAPMPDAYRSPGASVAGAQAPQAALVQDPQLRRLIDAALRNNRDLRKALLNVEAARAQFRVARADRLPSLSAEAGVQRSRQALKDRTDPAIPHETEYSASLGLSAFELDLFGRVKNLSESAFQEFLAQEQSAKAARISLVAAVSEAYLRYQAALAKQTSANQVLAWQQASLELVRIKRENAQASLLDEQEARGLVEQAKLRCIRSDGDVLQSGNALQLLLGEDALAVEIRQIQPGADVLAELAPGIPSDLLTRRPDLLAAEHRLAAANADIGAARAAFFPQISLTALWGAASPELSNLFSAENNRWQFTPHASLPIFAGGRNRATLDMAKLRKDAAIADYENVVQVAFTEVNNALIEASVARQAYQAQQTITSIGENTLAISKARYETGVDAYPRYLDAQVRYANTRSDQIDAWVALHTARVQLFKVLGSELRPEAGDSAVANLH